MIEDTFYQIYNVYGFLFELLLIELIFLMSERKKHLFVLRTTYGLLLCFVCTWAINLIPFEGWFNLLRFTASFLLTLFWIRLSFSLDWHESLFYGVASYGIQNLCYNLSMLIFPPQISMHIYGSFGFLYRHVVFVLFAVILILLFKHLLRDNRDYLLQNSSVLLSSAVILFITIIVSYIKVLYVPLTDAAASAICIIYTIICNALALALQFGLLSQSHWKEEALVFERMLTLEKKQYELTQNAIDLINTKSHDLKKQIHLIRQNGIHEDTERALSTMETAIDQYDHSAKTGNTSIDLILTQKQLEMNHLDITFSYMIDGKQFQAIDRIDLFALLGNILDNAIEAVSAIQDKEQRIIDLTATRSGDFLKIHCENFYTHTLSFHNGLPSSNKNDSDYHGYGLRSIQMTAEKYGGTMSLDIEEPIFRLTVLLPTTT